MVGVRCTSVNLAIHTGILLSTDQVLDKEKAEYKRWIKIFNARRDNPSLNDKCTQAEMLYELSKDSE